MLTAFVGTRVGQALYLVDQGLAKLFKLHHPRLLIGNDVIQLENGLFLVRELEFNLGQSVIGHFLFPWIKRGSSGH